MKARLLWLKAVVVLFFLGSTFGACGSDDTDPLPNYGDDDDTVVDETPTGDDDVPIEATYDLSLYIGPGVWTRLARAGAIDNSGQLFVTSGAFVYVVSNGLASTYLTLSDISEITGADPQIAGMDVDSDGLLYLFDKASGSILTSETVGDVTVLRDLSDIVQPSLMKLLDANTFVVVNYAGLWKVDLESAEQVFDQSSLSGGTNCVAESISLTDSGAFFYMPGCHGSALVGGQLSGDAVSILASSDTISASYSDGFEGLGRDRLGDGALVNLQSHIARFTTSGAYTLLGFQPTMDEIQSQDGVSFASRPVIEGPDGTIYIIGAENIYQATPF